MLLELWSGVTEALELLAMDCEVDCEVGSELDCKVELLAMDCEIELPATDCEVELLATDCELELTAAEKPLVDDEAGPETMICEAEVD